MVFSEDEVNKIPALKFSLQVQIEKKSNKVFKARKRSSFLYENVNGRYMYPKKTARKHLKKGHIQNKELVIPPGHFLSVRNCQNTLVSATLEDEMGQSYTENSSSILLQRSPLC
uniref:Uncharacterized protein LOC111119124 isoform X2 n=1 Tax=Crassostrea virginica TaxID=6565 RepID=A0A8B8CG57_CRAVI|nr:uncharacterized protein LOC111119124 isoform X2 [Crassostrea virginica]